MNKDELNKILKLHKKWLDEEEGGVRADLQHADLQRADLQDTNLLWAYLQDADLQRADLKYADLQYADLQRADLKYADLQRADLRDADLRGADLDHSCFPLWCGSKGVKLDRRLFLQLVAHICAVDVDDEECKQVQAQLTPLAIQSHVAWFLLGDE